MDIFLIFILIQISVSIIRYFLRFFLLVCNLCKSLLYILHYVSDTDRYANIVFLRLYLVLEYLEKLISTFWCFFSYFGVSINFSSWVCKSHNIFMTSAEIEAIPMFQGFLYCHQFQIIDSFLAAFYLVRKWFSSDLEIINLVLDIFRYVDSAYITRYLVPSYIE